MHWRSAILLLAAATGIVHAEPKVTFVATGNSGSPAVTAVLPSDPAFLSSVESLLPAQVLPAFQRVLPCSVVLRNNTADNIVAIVASVETSDQSGSKTRGTVVLAANVPPAGNFDFLLGPGRQMLLSADSGYAQNALHLKRQGFEPSEPERLEQLSRRSLDRYTSAAGITFVLDSVLFADGRFAGPDATGAVARWTRFLVAEQVFDKAALAYRGRPSDELRQFLASVAELRRRGSDDGTSGLARRWQRVLEHRGMEDVLNSVAADLKRAADFSIHREAIECGSKSCGN